MKLSGLMFLVIMLSCRDSGSSSVRHEPVFEEDAFHLVRFVNMKAFSPSVREVKSSIKEYIVNDFKFTIEKRGEMVYLQFGDNEKKIDATYYFFDTDSLSYYKSKLYSYLKLSVIDKSSGDGSSGHIYEDVVWLVIDHRNKQQFVVESHEIDWRDDAILVDYKSDSNYQIPIIEDYRSIDSTVLKTLTTKYSGLSYEAIYQVKLIEPLGTPNDSNGIVLYAFKKEDRLVLLEIGYESEV